MTTKTFALVTVISMFLYSCNSISKKETTANEVAINVDLNEKWTNVPFGIASNYFVRNTVKKLDNPKIETQEKFKKIFGMAGIMTDDGKPTEIDFSNQFVFAVILPKTDLDIKIKPVSLNKNEKGEMILTYKTTVGAKQSYIKVPNFAIIIDKAENGKITLTEVK